jgi:hypothetical protein
MWWYSLCDLPPSLPLRKMQKKAKRKQKVLAVGSKSASGGTALERKRLPLNELLAHYRRLVKEANKLALEGPLCCPLFIWIVQIFVCGVLPSHKV